MNYRICLAKGDTRFEAEGDKKFVLQMLDQYGSMEGPSAAAATQAVKSAPTKSTAGIESAAAPGKKTSVGEFIRQLEAKKHMDLVVAFGYYLEKIAGLTSFTVADINNCYYEAKLESSNTSQMIIQNVKKGFIMPAKRKEDQGRQAFVLTKTGEDYVSVSKFNTPKKSK
jgi:hypothetical protein